MKVIRVMDGETLEMLENESALTIEGVREEDAGEFIKWVKDRTPMKSEEVYIIKGRNMNSFYGLTGDNAYPDDLTIQAIPLNLIKDVMALVISRFDIGARWFDDIVENNKRREENEQQLFY